MNWKNFEIGFAISTKGMLFSVLSGGKTAAECEFSEGVLTYSMFYDYSDRPLCLSGKASIGDAVKVRILPYRIELYVNGILADEEWPCGKHSFGAHSVTGICQPTFSEFVPEKQNFPAVLGTFQNAEGWKPEENIFVGDCMPHSHEGVYHVLYLKDRHHHQSKWTKGAHQWAHISTEDFVTWSIHPMAVELDDPTEGSFCTGSWIFDGRRHYLFYTVRSCDASPAEIRRSVSEDGYHFEKDKSFSFALSERFTPRSARDPKLFMDDEGVYHMILTTGYRALGRGCIAHLTSRDLNEWTELAEPFFVAPEGMGEPECPDYFYKDGFYYLVYSLRGKGYYLYSHKPFSDWQTPQNPVIPCKSVPKAAVWNDRLIFTGFEGNGKYAGTMTFMEAVVKENGEFEYRKMN